jgi:hypothetical protein
VPGGETITYCTLRLAARVVLEADLVAGRLGWGCRRFVDPHSGERAAGRVADVRGANRAALSVRRDAVAILRHHARPGLAARPQTLDELLQMRCHPRRVAGQRHVALAVRRLGSPLRAPEHEIHARSPGDNTNAAGAALVEKVAGAGRPRRRS